MRPILDCTGYELWRNDVVRAVGASLTTRDGQHLIDFESGVRRAGLGHAPPRLKAVLHAHLDRALHLGYRVESALAAEAARAALDEILGAA